MLNCHRSHRPDTPQRLICLSNTLLCFTSAVTVLVSHLSVSLLICCLQDRRECERMQSAYSNQNRNKSLIFDSPIGFCKGKIKSSHFLFHAKPRFCFNMTVKSAFKSHIHSILAPFWSPPALKGNIWFVWLIKALLTS